MLAGFNVVGHFIIALLPAAMRPARMQPQKTGKGILNGKESGEYEKMTGHAYAKCGSGSLIFSSSSLHNAAVPSI
jgi:hypothetical protein